MTDLFKERAASYDSQDMAKELSSAIGTSLLAEIDFHDQMHVMDFGAGTGLICSQVAPIVQEITAVDISEAMLEKLMTKPDLKNKVKPVCQNIMTTPMDEKFDLIMSAFAMHHVEDTDKLIQRFAHHLDRGAKVALADLDSEDGSFHPDDIKGIFHFGFDRDNIRQLLEKHSFTNIEFVTAHNLEKEEKSYSIFLVTADKM